MKLYNAEGELQTSLADLDKYGSRGRDSNLAVWKNILMIKCTKSYVGNYYRLSSFRIVFRK